MRFFCLDNVAGDPSSCNKLKLACKSCPDRLGINLYVVRLDSHYTAVPEIKTYRSPLILWRFRLGLALGVLSRCGRCISLASALSIASASNRAVFVESRVPIPVRVRRVDAASMELRASKRPRPAWRDGSAWELPVDGDFSSLIAALE